jgi:hypothetical protein
VPDEVSVGRQDLAYVRRAGAETSLAQVLAGCTHELDLSRTQVGLDHQSSELVPVDDALPSGAERLGEQRHHLIESRVLDVGEQEAVRGRLGSVVGQHEPEVLEDGEDSRKRRPVPRPADHAPEPGSVRLPGHARC